ncbi:Bile salt-activated lipase [Metarhizium anisopliae]
MSPLNSPEGQYLSLAGSFQKSQKTLANNFKTWGLKPSSKNQAPTILAATEAAYTNSVKQVEDARNRQILILNEDWVNECCDKKSWIVPENKHIWENHSATAPNNPPNPLENPPPKPPNPPENPQPQPPNPPENPQPQPPNPPENPQPQPPNPPENPQPQPPNPPENPQPQPPNPPENPQPQPPIPPENPQPQPPNPPENPQPQPPIPPENPQPQPPNPPENPQPQPPNPPENPQPQPPNPPENPQPQPPNPPENPQPQPPIPPENPPKHESDNESMEVALLKKQIEDLKNSKTNSKDGPSDRYDQSEDQKECFEIFYEWSRRFDDTDDPNTNRFEVDCHPADINKPLSDRRKEYEMEIMLITQFRSYVFVIDPEGKIEGYDCLRPGYLIPRSDCPAAARKYEDNGGEIVRAKQKENLQGKQMTDFVWWSVATDPEGRFCYCLGAFKGDKRPSLYSRSTFKAKWGKLADDQINEIRREFSQAELNKQAKARSQKLLKLN